MNLPLAQFIALMPGGAEWIWILAIILLLFGGSKLPALAKGLGQSVKEFKKAAKEGSDDDEKPEKKAEPSTKPGNN